MKNTDRFHWGWRIAVVYSIFVIGTLTMVAIAFRTEVDLVREDYYQHSLQHDHHNAGSHNAKALPHGSFRADVQDEEIVLHIPFTSVQISDGGVQLFRPSTATTDKFYSLKVNQNRQMRIPTKGMAKGLWRVRLNFTADDVYYEKEIPIIIP